MAACNSLLIFKKKKTPRKSDISSQIQEKLKKRKAEIFQLFDIMFKLFKEVWYTF